MRPARREPLTVLVLAVGGNVSQGILKALARSSVRCRVIGTDVSALQMGLYTVDRAYVAPWAHDPDFINWLIRLCVAERVDVILSGCEPVLRALMPARERIEDASGAICLVNAPRVFDIAEDKLHTCEWLRAQGFAYPDFAASEDKESLDRVAREKGFPLIAKARVGGGAHGLMRLDGPADLEYIHRKSAYVVQECLGDERNEYTAGCFCDRRGVVCGTIVFWRELLAGTTYRACAGMFPEVRDAADRIANCLRPMGPCNLQFRMTGRGPVCFEINARFSGTAPLRAQFGFNEVEAALRHFVLGEPVPEFPTVTSGVALRYWNEMYVAPEAVAALEQDGWFDPTPGGACRIEPYGIP